MSWRSNALLDSHVFFTDLCVCEWGVSVSTVVFVVHLGPTFEFQMQEEHLRLTLNAQIETQPTLRSLNLVTKPLKIIAHC